MSEEEFVRFLQKNTSLPKDVMQQVIAESSPSFFLKSSEREDNVPTQEQAERMATILRKTIATQVAMYKTGTITKEEATTHRIEKLPDDFPF